MRRLDFVRDVRGEAVAIKISDGELKKTAYSEPPRRARRFTGKCETTCAVRGTLAGGIFFGPFLQEQWRERLREEASV